MKLSLTCFLRLSKISLDNNFNILEISLAIATLLYLIYQLIWIARILQDSKTLFYEEVHLIKYGSLFKDINVIGFLGRNIKLFSMIQKLIFCFILVGLHDFPLIQIILLMINTLWILIIYLISKPFISAIINWIKILEYILFLFIYSIMIYFVHLQNKSLQPETLSESEELNFINMGWLFVGVLCFLIIVSFLCQTIMLLIAIFSAWRKIFWIIKQRFGSKKVIQMSNSSKDEESIDRLIAKVNKAVRGKFDVEYKFAQIKIEFKK